MIRPGTAVGLRNGDPGSSLPWRGISPRNTILATVERAQRQSEAFRVSGYAEKQIPSSELRCLFTARRSPCCIIPRTFLERGDEWGTRKCAGFKVGVCSCAEFGAGPAVLSVRGEKDVTNSQSELLRPDGPDLQLDKSTSFRHQNYDATSRHLNFWLGSLWCMVLATGLSLSQALGAESHADCSDVAAYYAPVSGLEGRELKTKLHDIIKDHQALTYIQVWDALKVLDEAGDDPSSVIEIYSLKKVAKSLQGSTDGWNREHLWPRSYGLVMGRPEFTDLQNLRPSDINVNSSRGNKYFGECTASLLSKCLEPANKESAPDTAANKDIWMPPAQVRGDIARVLMYMAVRYGMEQPAGSSELQLSDSPSIVKAEMGRLSDLLRWNEVDPPSALENMRNNRICSLYQHNRNPFVDHPEYANSIWGDTIASTTQTSHVAEDPPAEKPDAWINEFHYDNKGVDQDEFVEVVVGPKVNPVHLTVVLYNGGDGKVYRSLPLRDGTIFSKGKDMGMGFTLFVAKLPSGSIQNGPRDGLALVMEDGAAHAVNVLQFLSYEGTLKALDGPAEGKQSVDIMVEEGSKTPPGSSLGLTGSGQAYGEFHWSQFKSGASPGSWNLGQTLRAIFRQLIHALK